MEVRCLLAELVADSVAAFGKTPLDVQMRTGDAAGATFETPLVIYTYAVFLQSINICWTEVEARLFLALFHTFLSIDYPKMTFFLYLKSV